MRRTLDAARGLSGRRQVTKLRRTRHHLQLFIGAVRRGAARGRVTAELTARLLTLASDAVASLDPLTR